MENDRRFDVRDGNVTSAPGITFTAIVHGRPRPQPRPNFTRNGTNRRARAYNPLASEQAEFHEAVRRQMKQGGNVDPGPTFSHGAGGLVAQLTFFMPRPKVHYMNKNSRLAENVCEELAGDRIPHLKKPDADNLGKFVLDALKGLVYTDDCVLYKIIVEKYYDNEGECKGRIEISITPRFITLE